MRTFLPYRFWCSYDIIADAKLKCSNACVMSLTKRFLTWYKFNVILNVLHAFVSTFFLFLFQFFFFILCEYIYSFLKIHLEKRNAGARVLRRIFRITTFIVWISLKLKTICHWVNVSLSFRFFFRSSICIHFVSGSIHIFQQFSSSVLSHHFIASFCFYYYYLLCAFFMIWFTRILYRELIRSL